MLEPPYEVLRCSWPRPAIHENGRWISEPEWNAPALPYLPQPNWEMIDGRPAFAIDWRETFRRGVRHPPNATCGDLSGFHVVFEIRVCADGRLSFWDDDGCVIRLGGNVVHCDRTAHALRRSEIEVRAGTRLCIAQWQCVNEWVWAASFCAVLDQPDCEESVLRHRDAVDDFLTRPNGPPLRVFSRGDAPVRTALAIYSMILNGYRPSQVELFGEHQWDSGAREFFEAMLPAARIHSTGTLLQSWRALGGAPLARFAQQHWFVMKACLGLLSPPGEFCLMDDDVFVLDAVNDALGFLQRCDAVFTPDTNHGAAYLDVWGGLFGNAALSPDRLPTARMNTGLLWLRPVQDSASLAALILQGRQTVGIGAWAWEQGLFANVYAHRQVHQLSSARYLLPLWEGLPRGVLGYDYRNNPCGFAAIHFAGLWNKPSNAAAAWLAPQILERKQEVEA
jgi:hypothetical protein